MKFALHFYYRLIDNSYVFIMDGVFLFIQVPIFLTLSLHISLCSWGIGHMSLAPSEYDISELVNSSCSDNCS